MYCTCCNWNIALPSAVLATLLIWLLGMFVEDVSTTVRTMGAAPPVHALCRCATHGDRRAWLAQAAHSADA